LSVEESNSRSISVKLPNHLVSLIDQLKREYGVRARGQVLEILLEGILGGGDADHGSITAEITAEITADGAEASLLKSLTRPSSQATDVGYGVSDAEPSSNESSHDGFGNEAFSNDRFTNEEVSSLVLIGSPSSPGGDAEQPAAPAPSTTGIDLPGFVSRRTSQLRDTLKSPKRRASSFDEPLLSTVSLSDLQSSAQAADDHWVSLYGQAPGDTVVEAAILWLARDLWPSLEASEGRAFTWSAANAAMQDLCPEWTLTTPSLGRVMVVAGALEDPFATAALSARMPTLVRRFVNRFRRTRQATSFETIESTMTVHGALKLLGLSTQAGAAVTLASIREAYRTQAMAAHPDAGGSAETMRRLNEAYRMLRELYRKQ